MLIPSEKFLRRCRKSAVGRDDSVAPTNYLWGERGFLSDDVAAAVTDVALGQPINGMIEVAGPDPIRQDELVRQFLSATGDARKVVTEVNARYFGIEVNDQKPGSRR